MVNLAQAKVPVECIEYVVLQGLLHLVDASHGERFIECVNTFLPGWRELRSQLNAQPLADLAARR